MSRDLPTNFEPLKQQLLTAAQAFSSEAQPLSEILTGLVNDVERACAEPLEIFPVCHHSPSAAVQMIRRLRGRPPRAIYLEACEDMQGALEGLHDCQLPVAIQSFATQLDALPAAWSPLSLVCPLTEFSAEFQAIAFALANPATELLFVDRSSDHVFQWMPQQDEALEKALPEMQQADGEDDDAAMHGSAIGVEIGALIPSFELFRQFLLKNARVQHFSEWWDQYVEEAILDSDYQTYRQVMFLVGSLFRRLGTRQREKEEDEKRERFMWTRIKQHLKKNKIDPGDAIYVCGAAHSASHVPEFGVGSDALWDIPPRTKTEWLHGLLPSSYSSIEHQFGHPHGAVTLAEARWQKSIKRQNLQPFALDAKKSKPKKSARSAAPEEIKAEGEHPLLVYLQKPPAVIEEDEAELLHNCVRIVELARKNGYLSSTADSIAVYQTAILLANIRNRKHPTPYDFRDAAVTCIEKEAVPRKRDVGRLCDILLGGDKIGRIGYTSLPPLAKDVYDRLGALPINLTARTIQRALLDFGKNPAYLPCSDLLWKLQYLIGDVVRPIMGQRELGYVPQQESWDVAIGKNQGAIIQLAYEGVTVEHVLERRLKKAAFGGDSRTAQALAAARDSILFLKSDRLTEELGERAVELLVQEPDVKDAREIYGRINRLVHYYRATPGGLPPWCQRFVTTGYSHYATMLPNAFADRGVTPEDLASMLQFIFTLESLALSLGCERSQLAIALKQSVAGASDFPKLALLWSAECVLQFRDTSSLRTFFDHLLDNELTLPSLPEYLGGFLLALAFTPLVSSLTVELMSKAFERLPDRILMPWLPKLLMMLRPHAASALPTLMKEAAAIFPKSLHALEGWTPPWERPPTQRATATPRSELSDSQKSVMGLLREFPDTTAALAQSFGLEVLWASASETISSPAATGDADPAVIKLLRSYPAALNALAAVAAPHS